ncbi:MAG: hypothetical protein ABSC60_15035 [Acidobacteriota bacterium]
MTGLFSLLDALLDCPMEKALAELPISREIKSALLGECNDLRKVLDMIVAYEKADWQSFSNAAAIAGLPEELFPPIYSSAIEWASNILANQ